MPSKVIAILKIHQNFAMDLVNLKD